MELFIVCPCSMQFSLYILTALVVSRVDGIPQQDQPKVSKSIVTIS